MNTIEAAAITAATLKHGDPISVVNTLRGETYQGRVLWVSKCDIKVQLYGFNRNYVFVIDEDGARTGRTCTLDGHTITTAW